MSLLIHENIIHKLDEFVRLQKIPNILFHGPCGSGKRTLVNNYVTKLYGDNKEHVRSYVLYTNCAHGKGIKFVRDELKFFAKTHISLHSNITFKTIILSNAHSLTIDAQSALRRCIEQFSHNTRFFVIVNDKAKLLKPILSRFCEIHVPQPYINSFKVNLHSIHTDTCFGKDIHTIRATRWFKKHLYKLEEKSLKETTQLSELIYENAYSGLDLMLYIDTHGQIDPSRKSSMLLTFQKVKKEFRNEKTFLLFILNFIVIRSNIDFVNVSFM